MSQKLPPCGIYRTVSQIGEVPAGQLVYFHNHGDPGPGVYLPERWAANKARFQARGHVLEQPDRAGQVLRPLSPEGFYRVAEPFHCCDQKCRAFEIDELVQLGYDGQATPLLFSPELSAAGMEIPETGTRIDTSRMEKLRLLKVPTRAPSTKDDDYDPGALPPHVH